MIRVHPSLLPPPPPQPPLPAPTDQPKVVPFTMLFGHSNNSSPGPDGTSYRLLKLMKDTDLGRADINDVAYAVAYPNNSHPPWEGLKVVIIQKPNKAHTTFQGWRPKVLSNTTSKLGEKCIADRIQRSHQGFYNLQYGSRKNTLATDAMVITISQIRHELRAVSRVTLLGKDIVAAFNHLGCNPTLERIREFSPDKLYFCTQFLTPRTFQIHWDGQPRGKGGMTEGTPQASPLSPVLCLFFLARTLRRADNAIMNIHPDTRRTSQRHAATRAAPSVQVNLMSYADDVNHIVVTRGTSRREYTRICGKVNEHLEENARKDNLGWDPQKDSRVTSGTGPIQFTTTLGITIN